MNLVFVSSLVPSGLPQSGYEIANQAIVDGMRRAGWRVTILGFKWPGATLSDPENTVCLGEVDVRTDAAGIAEKLIWLLTALRTGTTFSSAKLRIVAPKEIERTILEIGGVDGFVLNGVPFAGAFEEIFTRHPYIFVAHNVEHISARQNAAEAANPFEKLLFYREARYLKALEQRLCAGARFVLTLADEDRAPLGIADDTRSLTLPLVTPEPPRGETRTPAFDTGMIGTWTWAPNRIGLEWFLQTVLPLLPAEMTVAIAGKTPRDFPARDPRVLFLGRVDDAKEFMRQCRVIALASRAGTGVQLKTIETLEMGLPAVATTSSLRGISDLPENVVRADTSQDFARALAGAVVAQRTGGLADLDGSRFRTAQLGKMDAVLRRALTVFNGNSGNSGA